MAMKTASPWWFSAVFAGGLLLIFLGERPFSHIDATRLMLSGLGAAVVLAITGLRLWTAAASSGDRRRVERALLLCQAGALGAVLLYVLTTDGGRGLLGLGDLEGESLDRYMIPMTVLWCIGMAGSLVPLVMIETSLGTARRARFSIAAMRTSEVAEAAVEAFRVREMAASGLTIALAASFLMVTCNIAEQRNIRRDLSYFKTSSPGESTIRITSSVSEPIKFLLFFPEVNQVKNEVRGYLQSLAAAGGRITVEEHDRLLSAKLAHDYRVRADGTIVIVHDDKHETIKLTVDPDKARRLDARMELRELDSKINTTLLKLVRERRRAYMTVGHGELNDPMSSWGFGTGPQITQLENVLSSLNYEVENLGLMEGLGSQVPDDADMVMMLAPRTALSDEEMASLERYLAGGGKMLIALDPDGDATLGRLERRLGVRFDPTPITDDKNFFPRARNATDRRIIVTNRFSSHAAATTLSRGGPRNAILFINTGSIDSAEVPRDIAPRRTNVIRSMPEAFADKNGNFGFDEDTEQRRQYNLVVALESRDDEAGRASGDEAGEDQAGQEEDKEPMRVLLFSDADIFIDLHQAQFPVLSAMFADAIKWLGGEEHIAGEIESEKDVLIEHTRSEDVLWFYATIVGAPLVVMGFGLWFGWWRRQRTQRRRS